MTAAVQRGKTTMTSDKKLNFFELGALGFLLFAMFLGAGNIGADLRHSAHYFRGV